MSSTLVADWFGSKFTDLHPLLQQLHKHGGQLTGSVEVDIPNGIAGKFGVRLARKVGIPSTGRTHKLVVTISHHADGLHWDRCFDDQTTMKSVFKPVGTLPGGYWIESTGPLRLYPTVEIKDGGWHWRCLKMKMGNWSLPLWLFPGTSAFKSIESGQYRFYVGFNLPLFGTILSYSGLLTASTLENAHIGFDTLAH